MPQLGANDEAGATAIAAFLGSVALPGPAPAPFAKAGDRERGRRLFESVGCVACHGPQQGERQPGDVPLALAAHSRADALAAFLRDPLASHPAGRMPATELSADEAADLAAYLAAPLPPALARASEPIVIDRGHAQFLVRRCTACHETGGPSVAPAAAELARLAPERGCLAATPSREAADFGLSAAQRASLTAALRAIQAAPTPPAPTAEQRVTARMEQLNCYACHEWRGRGGVAVGRAEFFTARDGSAESLGELGRLPPKLDAAGRKLTAAWLEKLLAGHGGGVRPYLSARMPRFGKTAAADLVPALAEACRPVKPEAIDVSGAKGNQRAAAGRALMGTGEGGLGCVACHGLRDREPPGVRAINLTPTGERLNPEYFKALLLDPQRIQPGTIMPPLFAARKGAEKEIEAIWTFLREVDQSPWLPPGLFQADSFELKPAEEGRPMVFRTFLVGAGMQVIAVGFPAGINVAFDSLEVRWALVWRGRFLDAISNWEDRSNPPVKPLGAPVRTLPFRAPLARRTAAGQPWPGEKSRAAGSVFHGYRLSREGVPTFLYTVEGIEVEDTMRPVAGRPAVERTVVLHARGTESGWLFRGAQAEAAPQPITWQNGEARFTEVIEP
jgi:mono/diheme cytochrome c family protein